MECSVSEKYAFAAHRPWLCAVDLLEEAYEGSLTSGLCLSHQDAKFRAGYRVN